MKSQNSNTEWKVKCMKKIYVRIEMWLQEIKYLILKNTAIFPQQKGENGYISMLSYG